LWSAKGINKIEKITLKTDAIPPSTENRSRKFQTFLLMIFWTGFASNEYSIKMFAFTPFLSKVKVLTSLNLTKSWTVASL